jgi:ASC-1-like (ASCH) protein
VRRLRLGMSFLSELVETGGMPTPRRLLPRGCSVSTHGDERHSVECHGESSFTWAEWSSGESLLREIKLRRVWPDGVPTGRGHPSPYLKPKHAINIRSGRKTVEGRAMAGFAAIVRANDWINFNISQSNGRRLVCRVLWVKYFDTFDDMLVECTIAACLPDFDGTVADAAAVYRAFATFAGETYADLEARAGAVAIGIQPL